METSEQARHQVETAGNLLSCQECNRHFTRPENLARHAKTHAKLQKHACNICDRTFTRSDVRNKHERLHERSSTRPRRSKRHGVEVTWSQTRDALTPNATRHSDRVIAQQESVHNMDSNTLLPDSFVHFRDSTAVSETPSHRLSQPEIPELNQVDHPMLHAPTYSALGSQDPYFDYVSFARPWNDQCGDGHDINDWFSDQFFAALRETDLSISPNDHSLLEDVYKHGNDAQDALADNGDGVQSSISSQLRHPDVEAHVSHIEIHANCASRVPSPPNEASYEDRLPFAWNPSSKPIARARAINLPEDDAIFSLIDPKLSIESETRIKVHEFLLSAASKEQQDTFTMPCLRLTNVFIILFFNKFYPQAPVIHLPTADINGLPPPLLAIMIAIGSTYSRLRHSRRFGIILFDRIRLGLQSLIERDNSQMREPLIIYSVGLTCFMGLWCGNKRAFEFAEVLRAAAVTYIRRLPPCRDGISSEPEKVNSGIFGASKAWIQQSHRIIHASWLAWTIHESRKRLCWFVYMLDAQFPSILGMSGMLSLGDIRRWECPCDDEFWDATSARAWSNLVGSATMPSSPVFGPIAAAFTSEQLLENRKSPIFPRLNAWSAFLVLSTIASDIHLAEQTALARRMTEEEPFPYHSAPSGTWSRLEAWDQRFRVSRLPSGQLCLSPYFLHSSGILYYLARIFLHIPLSDIQDCLGRNGAVEATTALARIREWMQTNPENSSTVIGDAARCIDMIVNHGDNGAPYDLIGLFLCHLTIWACAVAGSKPCKMAILNNVRSDQSPSPGIIDFIEAGFGLSDGRGQGRSDNSPQLILRHAIQSLVCKGTWGASSNLALLLHLRPESANMNF